MQNSVKRKIRNDLILIGAVVALVLIAFAIFMLCREGGNDVVVLLDGREVARYSLSDELTIEIDCGGGKTNTLVISGGRADIIHANCQDKICEEHRPISDSGQTIVCLPHRLVIEID